MKSDLSENMFEPSTTDANAGFHEKKEQKLNEPAIDKDLRYLLKRAHQSDSASNNTSADTMNVSSGDTNNLTAKSVKNLRKKRMHSEEPFAVHQAIDLHHEAENIDDVDFSGFGTWPFSPFAKYFVYALNGFNGLTSFDRCYLPDISLALNDDDFTHTTSKAFVDNRSIVRIPHSHFIHLLFKRTQRGLKSKRVFLLPVCVGRQGVEDGGSAHGSDALDNEDTFLDDLARKIEPIHRQDVVFEQLDDAMDEIDFVIESMEDNIWGKESSGRGNNNGRNGLAPSDDFPFGNPGKPDNSRTNVSVGRFFRGTRSLFLFAAMVDRSGCAYFAGGLSQGDE